MNSYDIVKLVRRLMKRYHRGHLSRDQVEQTIREQLQGDDQAWALSGVKAYLSYRCWPPIQQGSKRLLFHPAGSRWVDPNVDHLSRRDRERLGE